MSKKTRSFKENIFLYNKKDELITYVDINSAGEVVGYYNLSENVLTKVNVESFKEKNKLHTDIKKAIITFGEDCKLFHMFLDGDSYCKVVKKGTFKIAPPIVISSVYSHNEDSLEGYTINNNMIQDWLKKL